MAGHFGQGHKGGWRYPFLLYGGAGLAVSVVLLLVRACPCKSEYADADEEAAVAEQRRPSFRVPSVLRERCLLYTSPSPRDQRGSRMPSSA